MFIEKSYNLDFINIKFLTFFSHAVHLRSSVHIYAWCKERKSYLLHLILTFTLNMSYTGRVR